MKKYSTNNILKLTTQYEKKANALINKRRVVGFQKQANVAAMVVPILVPIVLNVIHEEMISVKNLREGTDKVIEAARGLQKTVDDPGWESVMKAVGNIGGYAGFGGAVGGLIGGIGGGIAGFLGGPAAPATVPAGIAAGAATGATWGAGIGAGYGTAKTVSDIAQVTTLIKELPKHSKEIEKFISNLKKVANLYDKLEAENSNKSDISKERYQKIVQYSAEFGSVIEDVQLQATNLTAEAENMKTSFSKITDQLSYISVSVFSQLKDFQDAVGKLYPEISKAVTTAKRLNQRISEAEKSNQKSDSKESKIEMAGNAGKLSW